MRTNKYILTDTNVDCSARVVFVTRDDAQLQGFAHRAIREAFEADSRAAIVVFICAPTLELVFAERGMGVRGMLFDSLPNLIPLPILRKQFPGCFTPGPMQAEIHEAPPQQSLRIHTQRRKRNITL